MGVTNDRPGLPDDGRTDDGVAWDGAERPQVERLKDGAGVRGRPPELDGGGGARRKPEVAGPNEPRPSQDQVVRAGRSRPLSNPVYAGRAGATSR